MTFEQQEYEKRELDRALRDEKEINRLPLSDRKENQQRFFEAMRDDPAIVAERLGWVFNGSYGKGAQLRAQQVLASPRMNRQAALNQLTGIYEWRCPGVMIVDAWKKLSPSEKSTLQGMIEIVIQEAENEMRENGELPAETRSTARTANGRDLERHERAQKARLSTMDFYKGQRVELHPATDAWMRGDKFGEITKVGREKIHVKMDRSKRTLKIAPSNLTPVDKIRDQEWHL